MFDQSTQSVKTVVYLRKRSHNQLSPQLCNKLRGEEPLQIFLPHWTNVLDIV